MNFGSESHQGEYEYQGNANARGDVHLVGGAGWIDEVGLDSRRRHLDRILHGGGQRVHIDCGHGAGYMRRQERRCPKRTGMKATTNAMVMVEEDGGIGGHKRHCFVLGEM